MSFAAPTSPAKVAPGGTKITTSRITKRFEFFQRVAVIIPRVAAFNLLRELAQRVQQLLHLDILGVLRRISIGPFPCP